MNRITHSRRSAARRQLGLLLESAEGFDLIEAALWVAAEEYGDLEVDLQLKRVHLICAEGARRAEGRTNPFARYDVLRSYLFEELGFRGNPADYGDPRNSYLNEVLDRKLGIPLSLSMLFIELARAAGFEARGVGLPGHFVTSISFGGRTLLIDPYHAGRLICEDDCRQLVAKTTGRPSLFRRPLLQGTDERAMLTRMLLNLKHVYVKRADYPRALSMVERLLLISPDDPTELRDRGFLHAHLGRPGAALADLESYLTLSPDAPDASSIRGRVQWLRRQMSELN